MYTFPAPLADTAHALRNGEVDLPAYVDDMCDRLDLIDPQIQALLPEPARRERLLHEAGALQARFPDPARRPPLYGILVGVKDVFHVDGYETRAGSTLAPDLFAGTQASCVTALRQAGALVLGKTVTTEFAYLEPGATRNPHHLEHTPGGSSSGSAAAVAAGLCSLALGTQTVGSVIRPAAFCGIVGFKPSYGRIPADGLIPFSESADHIGLFTQDVAGMNLAASQLCRNWQPARDASPVRLPGLGVPDGAYLAQATSGARAAFELQLRLLEKAGYVVKRVPAFQDLDAITRRHRQMIAAEMAHVHASWFTHYQAHYRPRTAALIREGYSVSAEALAAARAGRLTLRTELQALMRQFDVDIWISPAAPGPAPPGIETTGDPAMNLPWTHAGLPTVTLPAGLATGDLPLGLQCTASFMADEQLLLWAEAFEQTL